MTQEVKIKESVTVLDIKAVYSGSDNIDDSEKLVRKAVWLPIIKQGK